MIRDRSNTLVLGVIFAVGVTMAVAVLSRQAYAQLQPRPRGGHNLPAQSPAEFQVGTYDVQTVFKQHPAQKQLMEAFTTIQSQLRQAKANDEGSQKIQQLEQQYEQISQHTVELFQRDVGQALPTVAEETGVKVIALQVVYTGDDSEVVDVTPDLIEVLGKQNEEGRPTSPAATQQRLPNQ